MLSSRASKIRSVNSCNRRKFWREIETQKMKNRKIGRGGEKICSSDVEGMKEIQDGRNDDFLKTARLFDEYGNEVKMPETSVDYRRFCGYYARARGIEELAGENGLVAVFMTSTLPGEWHPNPQNGAKKWNEATPSDSHQILQKKWRALSKTRGYKKIQPAAVIRVAEAHADGCTHHHAMVWLSPENVNEYIKRAKKIFAATSRSFKYKIIEKKSGGASPVTYLTKYLLKGAGQDFEGTDNPAKKNKAWKSTWGIRGIDFFGSLIHGTAGGWNEARRCRLGTPSAVVEASAEAVCLMEAAQGTASKKHSYAKFVKLWKEKKGKVIRKCDEGCDRARPVGFEIDNDIVITKKSRFVLVPGRAETRADTECRHLRIVIQEGTRTHAYMREDAITSPPKPPALQIFHHHPGIRPPLPPTGSYKGGWCDVLDRQTNPNQPRDLGQKAAARPSP
jgi:hypothetical protein